MSLHHHHPHCHDHHHEVPDGPIPPGYPRILWLALAVNALMFVVEIAAGVGAA